MLKKILLGLVLLLVVLVVVGFLIPDSVHVERSAVIDAPACTVYAQLASYPRVNLWSPWFELDPDMEITYSGPAQGVGARMSWKSENPQVGSGWQEITSAEPYQHVKVHLDFGGQGEADAAHVLTPEGDGATRVTWSFDTSFEGDLVGRYFGLFFDSMIGKDFEKGLAKLETLAEGLPQANWCGHQVEVVELPARFIASAKGESGTDPEEIAAALGAVYGEVVAFLVRHGQESAGRPLTIEEAWGEEGYRFEAALPLAADPGIAAEEGATVVVRELPATRAARLVHVGPYIGMEEGYAALGAYMAAHGYEATGQPWSVYVSDPTTTPEAELITHLHYPIGG